MTEVYFVILYVNKIPLQEFTKLKRALLHLDYLDSNLTCIIFTV